MPKEQPTVAAGSLIRGHMQAHGITEAAAAAAAGMSQPALHRLITDQSDPPLSTLMRVLGAVGLSLRWLHDHGVRPTVAENVS